MELTYKTWDEYFTLETYEERREWIKKHCAIERRRKEWRRTANFRAALEAAVCDHAVVKPVTPVAEDDRGIALDEITEIRCTNCRRLMGLSYE